MLYKQNNRGFTLIELLVVIAIIGILSSVVLASLNTAREKARDTKRISDIKNIQLALELYFDSKGVYPDTTQGIAELVPTYITILPTPPSGAAAAYFYSGKGTNCISYHLGAQLEADETSNPVLRSDVDGADQDAEAVKCLVGTADFLGNSTDCDTTAGNNAERCYDVSP